VLLQRNRWGSKLDQQKREPECSRKHRTNARRDGAGSSRGTRWGVRRPSGWRADCDLRVSTRVCLCTKRDVECGVDVRCKGRCRRPSAVVNLSCVTNRVAQGPRYKLSYDAKTIKEHKHSPCNPIPTTPAPNRATPTFFFQ
jgi:hypothetical protein